jgi:16S rRNA (cytosine1402-N4)-methyltransferase
VAVLADLGVSSPQLDRSERGFSFRAEGPIDMRMNPEAGESAAELLDRLEEGELADLLFQFGEERLSRRIARRLVAEREAKPWRERNTSELAYAVAGCYLPVSTRKAASSQQARSIRREEGMPTQ